MGSPDSSRMRVSSGVLLRTSRGAAATATAVRQRWHHGGLRGFKGPENPGNKVIEWDLMVI